MIHLLGMCLLLMRKSGVGAYIPLPYVNPIHYPIPQPNLTPNINPVRQVYPIKNIGPPMYQNVQQGYPIRPRYQQGYSAQAVPVPHIPPVNPIQNNRMILMPVGGATPAPTNPNTKCECGMENTKPQENVNRLLDLNFNPINQFNRIIDGDDTGENQYPWMVQIQSKIGHRPEEPKAAGSLGGGVIISPLHILTAAHNVEKIEKAPDGATVLKGAVETESLRVMVGYHINPFFSRDGYDPFEAKHKKVEKIILHAKYTPTDNLGNPPRYDFAILKLSSHRARPVCIPASDSTKYDNQMAKATGWGTTTGMFLHKQGLTDLWLQYIDVLTSCMMSS